MSALYECRHDLWHINVIVSPEKSLFALYILLTYEEKTNTVIAGHDCLYPQPGLINDLSRPLSIQSGADQSPYPARLESAQFNVSGTAG